jgi:hypothetical protein
MEFDEVVRIVSEWPAKDKMRLSQVLMQLIKQEEDERASQGQGTESFADKLDYVIERIKKSKPTKLEALSNFIKAMFNFKGGISEAGIKAIIEALCERKFIAIIENKVRYLK